MDHSQTEATAAPTPCVDQNGRALGPRALNTRTRLLEATEQLLEEKGIRDISVVEIAKRAGTSPATFYQYFKDVYDATYDLAERASMSTPEILKLIDGSWDGETGLETARAIVDAFAAHRSAHRSVLRFRDLAGEEGSGRFARLRAQSLVPIVEHLASQVAAAQQCGQVAAEIHANTAAASLASMLERVVAYYPNLDAIGVTRESVVETCSRILYQTVTGRNAPPG